MNLKDEEFLRLLDKARQQGREEAGASDLAGELLSARNCLRDARLKLLEQSERAERKEHENQLLHACIVELRGIRHSTAEPVSDEDWERVSKPYHEFVSEDDYTNNDDVAKALRAEDKADMELGRLVRAMPPGFYLLRYFAPPDTWSAHERLIDGQNRTRSTPEEALRAAGCGEERHK